MFVAVWIQTIIYDASSDKFILWLNMACVALRLVFQAGILFLPRPLFSPNRTFLLTAITRQQSNQILPFPPRIYPRSQPVTLCTSCVSPVMVRKEGGRGERSGGFVFLTIGYAQVRLSVFDRMKVWAIAQMVNSLAKIFSPSTPGCLLCFCLLKKGETQSRHSFHL